MSYKMLSKKVHIFILLLIIVISIYFIFNGPSKEERVSLTDNNYKELKLQQNESASMFERSWGDETLFSPINAVDGTKDEYVTYYVYQTASLLGQAPSINFCQTQLEELQQDPDIFTNEDNNLIFTGIERVFRANKSIEICHKDVYSLLKTHTDYLLDNTYEKQGYFISNEFKEYKNKPEYMEVKLQQTYMMLELINKFGKLKDLDTKQIKSWIDQIDANDFSTLETILRINKLLGYEMKIEIDNEKIKQLVNKKNYDFIDLLMLNSLTYITKFQKEFNLDEKAKSIIINKLLNYRYGLSDIQSEYYRLNILTNLNKTITEKEKQVTLNDFSAYAYENGVLPTISLFNNPFSPNMIGRYSVGQSGHELVRYDENIYKHLNEVKISELIKMDAFEVFSFVSLLDIIDEELETNKKRELMEFLLKNAGVPIDSHNIMDWSFYTRSLLILEGSIGKGMLPETTEKILNKIVASQKNYFDNNNDVSTLVFLDTLARTGLYPNKIKMTEEYISKVNADSKSEIAAYIIYYKTSLLEEAKLPYNKNKIAIQVKELFKITGYALNNKEYFPDIYSTYLLMQTNSLLLEDK